MSSFFINRKDIRMSSQQRKQLAHEAEVKHLTNAKVSFIPPLRRFLFAYFVRVTDLQLHV